jgi:hypothetical protein
MRFLIEVLDGTTGSNGSPTGTQWRHGSVLRLDLVICVGLFFTLPIVHYGTCVSNLSNMSFNIDGFKFKKRFQVMELIKLFDNSYIYYLWQVGNSDILKLCLSCDKLKMKI